MAKKKARKEKAPPTPAKPKAARVSKIVTEISPARLLRPASDFAQKTFSTEEIVPGFIWVVHDFLTESECQAWVDFVEKEERLEYVQHPASKYITNRECFRWQRDDQATANILFQRMQVCGVVSELKSKVEFPSSSYVPRACNSNIRLYKYEKDMSFGKHVDESNPIEGIGQTEVTVLVYLSDCQGGATRFYPHTSGKRSKSVAFAPKRGAMLVHIHGDRCLEHEADPVLQGLKYILRTDIVYG